MIQINKSSPTLFQLVQLITATWDGDLISKRHRDELVKVGLVESVNGWNIITPDGLKLLDLIKVISF